MKLFSFFSLRQWLTVPYVALTLGVAVLIGILSYRTGSQAVDTLANHLLQETVARIGQAVDRHVVGSAAVLEAAFPNGMAGPESVMADLDSLRTRFWIATSLHLDPNNYVYYGNQQGQFLGLWRFNTQDAELRIKRFPDQPRRLYRFSGINGKLSDETIEKKMFEPRQRPWYKAGESSTSHTWTAIYIDFRNYELVATRARRVLDRLGHFQGVVATDLSLKRLNEFVRTLSLTAHAIAFIIEPDGKLIASSRTPNIVPLPDGTSDRINAADSDNALQRAAYAEVRRAMGGGATFDVPVTARFVGPDHQPIELAFERVRDDAGLDWIIVVAVPRNDFMQDVTGNVQRTVVIGVCAAMLAVALGLNIMGWIGRDLRRLTDAAQAIGEGRLEVPLEVARRDEIGVLASTFRQMQQRLRTDLLTGLDNREMMIRSINERLAHPRRAGDSASFAVLFVDLNNFKLVNDRLGHEAGDRALNEFANRLRAVVRAGDRIARYAGDEFVLMVDDIPSREIADQARMHIEEALRQPLASIDMTALPEDTLLGAAVGMAFYPDDGDKADELIKRSDQDMYERKRILRQRYRGSADT